MRRDDITVDAHRGVLLCAGAKTCPFCGSLAVIQKWHGGGPEKRMISCGAEDGKLANPKGRRCDVYPAVTGETRSLALRRWNKRSA